VPKRERRRKSGCKIGAELIKGRMERFMIKGREEGNLYMYNGRGKSSGRIIPGRNFSSERFNIMPCNACNPEKQTRQGMDGTH
jgi:hypothetical protein